METARARRDGIGRGAEGGRLGLVVGIGWLARNPWVLSPLGSPLAVAGGRCRAAGRARVGLRGRGSLTRGPGCRLMRRGESCAFFFFWGDALGSSAFASDVYT